MCSRVNDAVAVIIVRLIFAVTLGIKSKLQDLHAGISRFLQQFMYFRSEETQILGDDLTAADRFLQCVKQLDPRALHPGPVHSRILLSGNLIIGFESAEVVDPDCVVEEEGALHAGSPPGKILRPVPVPVIDRISPELSRRGKSVRRASGDYGRTPFAVQLEVLRMAPGIRAVHSDIDRQIADYTDPVFVGVIFDRLPLQEKHILQEAIETDVVHQLGVPFFHGLRLPEADIIVPFCPGGIFKTALERAVKRVIFKPFLIICDKSLESITVPVVSRLFPYIRRMQGVGTVFIGMV